MLALMQVKLGVSPLGWPEAHWRHAERWVPLRPDLPPGSRDGEDEGIGGKKMRSLVDFILSADSQIWFFEVWGSILQIGRL